MSMFEKATRFKLRFETNQGAVLSVEDLWDLPLTGKRVNLDQLAKTLNKQIKESEEESFVVQRSSANTELNLKFDIVKHVIGVKLEENAKQRDQVKRKQELEKINELIAKKQDQEKENLSVEELITQRDALQNA